MINIQSYGPKTFVGIKYECSLQNFQSESKPVFEKAYAQITQYCSDKLIGYGNAACLYLVWDSENDKAQYAPVFEINSTSSSDFDGTEYTVFQVPESNAYTTLYTGPYENLPEVHMELNSKLIDDGVMDNVDFTVEEYLVMSDNPNELETIVAYTLKN
ncbi:MAG: hypothetical protein ACRCXZ_09295 [Patescibacteria group bacterium]